MNDHDLRLVEAAPLRYLIAVPEASAPPGGWPVLCFLHGYDEGAPLDIHEALTRHGPLRPEHAERVRDRFVIVAPQLPTRGDVWRRYGGSVLRLVREVQARHGGDPWRTYLTGFSFGGNGVFDLALAQPDLWAALWPVDPTRVPHDDPQRPVWLSIGEVARRRTKGFVQALDLKPVDEGGERIYLDEGEDHVGSARSAYDDARCYD